MNDKGRIADLESQLAASRRETEMFKIALETYGDKDGQQCNVANDLGLDCVSDCLECVLKIAEIELARREGKE